MKKANTTTPKTRPVKVDLGDIMVRSDVVSILAPTELDYLLLRHECGDWGEIGIRGEQLNEQALRHGDKLFSVYEIADQKLLLVMTDEDREATYVALKDDPIWEEVFANFADEPAIATH